MDKKNEFNEQTIAEVQESFFLNKLPNRKNKAGIYYYKTSGLKAHLGHTLVLFQYDNMVIASATLYDVQKFDSPQGEFNGALFFKPETIKIFRPITHEELSEIFGESIKFSQVKQKLAHDKATNFLNSLVNIEPKMQSEINTIDSDIENIINNSSIEDTERISLVMSRVGQGQFRKTLIDHWGKCSVTGYKDKLMLVASHIKPWSNSSSRERLDKFNGLLLTPTLDRAFDQGLISFSKSGDILISHLFPESEILGISENMSFEITPQHEVYMEYHREHVYKKT